MACALGIEYPCNECRMCMKDKKENLLILPIKKKWFDMILSGKSQRNTVRLNHTGM